MEGIGFVILENHEIPPGLYVEVETKGGRVLHGHARGGQDEVRGPARGLGQPGLFPHQADQPHASRPRRGLGLLPAGLQPGREPGLPRDGLLARGGVRALLQAGHPAPREADPAAHAGVS